jgi:hypothetical protein
MAVGLADERALTGAKVDLPEQRIVPAEHADEPLHRPREEGGANQQPPIPGDHRHGAEAGRQQVVDEGELPLTASQQLRPLQRLVDDIANRAAAR